MSANEVFEKVKEIINYTVFTFNETPITLLSIILFLLIIFLFVIVSRLIKNRLLPKLLARFGIDEGIQFTLIRITHYIIVLIGVVFAFQFIGVDLTGLAIILGFLSVGIGFGLQNVTSNFIAGIILLFERPIQVGDRITVGDTEGDVENINIRSTTVKSINNISIIVPNSEFISSQVINWSHGDKKIRVDLDIGVSYHSDLDLVLKALREVADENSNILKSPEPEVHFKGFGDSSWNMSLRVWIDKPHRHYYVRSDINCAVVRKFRQYNIEIPFPQRDLHLRSAITMPVSQS